MVKQKAATQPGCKNTICKRFVDDRYVTGAVNFSNGQHR